MSLFYISLWFILKKNLSTRLQNLYRPPRNIRAGNKLLALFLKNPLCTSDLLPMGKILIERPANISQTPLLLILLSKYTMDKKNEKLVMIANSVNYHQVTWTFSFTLSGIFLPTQIIYQKMKNCFHAKLNSPEEFNITHSVNHWSNMKAIKLIEKIILPYVKKKGGYLLRDTSLIIGQHKVPVKNYGIYSDLIK